MYTLSPVNDDKKLDILRWRNSDHVRKSMVSTELISVDGHLAWWERIKADASKRLLILQRDGRDCGVITFFDISHASEGRVAWWGFYPADGVVMSDGGLGVWLVLECAALAYAFDVLGLDALLCETRADNFGVLSLHDRLGFETLKPDAYPNAVKHGLVVKRLDRINFERARKAGDIMGDEDLCIEAHPFDRPLAAEFSLRLAVLGSANWDLGARRLVDAFANWLGWAVDVYVPPFGQATLDLLDPESPLRSQPRDAWIFAERFEDFCDPFAILGQDDGAVVRERFTRYENSIRRAREDVGGLFLVHELAPVRAYPRSFDEATSGSDSVSQLCLELNQRLMAMCKDLPDTIFFPTAALVRSVGSRNADPGKYWLMGRIAYGVAMLDAWADSIIGAVLAQRGAVARALVLDLDNTLWGGVIGDDGISGIKLSSDYPGNEFKAVQHVVAALKSRGLPLVISSKNTDLTAMDAIRAHPEMVLSEKDFVARRINWLPKSQNIHELADELSLGIRSLMFIDDNPIERAETRRNCPGLIVPEMPDDVALWPDFLLQHPALTAISLSAEDMQRTKSYDIRRQIIAAEQSAPSREAFLKELGMTLEALDASERTMQRVMQLIVKTNQFNTTSRRYSMTDLADKTANGSRIMTLRLKDKYGSDELIGVLVVDFDTPRRRAIIDNFVMSCRVLGRGVEAGALAVVGEAAIARGCDVIEGRVIITERNEPCRNVFLNNNFIDLGDQIYERDLRQGPPPRPDWLEIVT